MKSMGAAFAAALLLGWTAAGRAGEPIPAPHDMIAGGAPAAAPHDMPTSAVPSIVAPDGAFPAGPGCATCNTGGGRHCNLWAWLTYRPLHRTRPCECCGCCGRWVPLYLYFLGHCQEHPCTSCGCAGGCCGWAGHAWSGAPTGVGFINH